MVLINNKVPVGVNSPKTRARKRRNGNDVLTGRQMRREFPEILTPSTGGQLRPVGDQGFAAQPTDHAKIVVARASDGSKQVLVWFSKIGVCYPIKSLSELQQWRDTFGALIDQIKRPGLEGL